MIDPVIGYIVLLGIAALMGSAGLHKLRGRQEFFQVLAAYRLLPGGMIPAAAHLLAGAELLTALGLIVPASRPAAGVTAAALLIAYGAAIGINLVRGRRDLDCGCSWAGGRRPIAAWMLARNAVLALAALAVALPWGSRPLSWIDLMTVIAGASASALLYASTDALLGRVAGATATATGTAMARAR